jgi:hypothetical protein
MSSDQVVNVNQRSTVHLADKGEGADCKTADSKRGGKAQCAQECDYRLFQKIVYTEVAKARPKTE